MRPIRTTILAAVTAAIAIAPLASAEAGKRHRRHDRDIAAAIALGLFTAGALSQAHRHHRYHRHGRQCYGLPLPQYEACMAGYYYGPQVVYPPYYGHRRYYRNGVPDRVINGR
ncbi:MAG: hypothetical protein R3D45_01700 [Rhizobiaceae bacterium]